MNRKAKALHKQGRTAINNGASHSERAFEPFKGKQCVTAFALREHNPENKKKGPRNGVRCEKPEPLTRDRHI